MELSPRDCYTCSRFQPSQPRHPEATLSATTPEALSACRKLWVKKQSAGEDAKMLDSEPVIIPDVSSEKTKTRKRVTQPRQSVQETCKGRGKLMNAKPAKKRKGDHQSDQGLWY